MMNRDSNGWWVVIGATFFTSLASQPELVEKVLERNPQAIVALISMALSVAAGVMRASPINSISDDGKAKYESDRVKLQP